MIEKLEQLISELGDLNSKLILLVGSLNGGGKSKTALLRTLGERAKVEPLNVGIELGRRLSAVPINKRAFSAGELLRELADQHATGGLLLLDNLELLFEKDLQVNPLNLLKRLAHAQKVVAVWPGSYMADRLIYADMGHPEHREYGCDGLVIFETNLHNKK
ncbi:MAG: BREX-3 system P-loop-containing protein BrxF [Gallionella sp.]|nr:BREX-3 system P-loop-containing protein BrxF [Gallionella sp.]